jgi:adenine-specific DNA-methyltransferase
MKKLTELDGSSLNMVNENLEALKAIFPEAFTEDGVDFEVLRQLLGNAVDEDEEKYGLNWHGKNKARQIALTPSLGTLRPCKEESVDWDTTQNLFVEGDNLEVLKLLQKSYANKVKMIYIDPPYNTGNEFIYPDKFQDNLDTYLRYTGQKGEDGLKISSNTETSGRYHTNWLNMMYSRLKLSRNLLREDGAIFISIDDNELSNLKILCDEIYGENNFIGLFVINSSPSAIDYGNIAKMHDYAIFYAKNIDEATTNYLPEKDKKFKYSDEIGPFNLYPLYNGNVAFNPETRPNLYYPFYLNPIGKIENDFYEIGLEKKEGWVEVYPVISRKDGIQRVWRWGKKKSRGELNREIIGYKTDSGEYRVVQKTRLTGKVIRSLQVDKDISSRRGTGEVENLFGSKVFTFPKPLDLIKRFIYVGMSNGDIILDFFAGSAPTANAILDLNSDDEKNRKFILVQLPEPTYDFKNGKKIGKKGNEGAFKAGYETISDLGKERIRRAAVKIKEENPEYEGDLGFKVFKLDSSNIRAWNPDRNNLEQTLIDHMEHLVEGRSEEDVLYELLLKRGVDLTVPIEEKKITGKTVYSIGYGVLFACLYTAISREEIEDLAQGIIDWHKELKPAGDTQVVFRDSAFANDIAKTNMTAILEQNGIKHVRSL